MVHIRSKKVGEFFFLWADFTEYSATYSGILKQVNKMIDSASRGFKGEGDA